MNFVEYQIKARETRVFPDDHKVVYPALALSGETGELANKIKRIMRRGDSFADLDIGDKLSLIGEIGDVLWYLSALADDLGFDLDGCARMNLTKLAQRAAKGQIKEHS